jgi:hypothetical protein
MHAMLDKPPGRFRPSILHQRKEKAASHHYDYVATC